MLTVRNILVYFYGLVSSGLAGPTVYREVAGSNPAVYKPITLILKIFMVLRTKRLSRVPFKDKEWVRSPQGLL